MSTKTCYSCKVNVSKANWGKHIKTKKHLKAVQAEILATRHCGFSNRISSDLKIASFPSTKYEKQPTFEPPGH